MTVVVAEPKTKLNELQLNILLRSVTSSLDDLRVASHKVEDVDNQILEEDWKIKHSTVDSHLLFLSYVGMVTTSLTRIFCAIVVVQSTVVNDVPIF
jgi:hypothetical protein